MRKFFSKKCIKSPLKHPIKFKYKSFDDWFSHNADNIDIRGYAYPIVKQAWNASRELDTKE